MKVLQDKYFTPTAVHLDTETHRLLQGEYDEVLLILIISNTKRQFSFGGERATKPTVFASLDPKL